MEKELAGMNHCIGSPATYTGYGFVQNLAHAVLYGLLNGWYVGLPLPASVVKSLVAYLNKVSQWVPI